MVKCSKCGADILDDNKFCDKCGAAVIPVSPVNPVNPASGGQPPPGSPYEVMSTGGFVVASIIMCIPVVGLVVYIIWACGGCKNLNRRNFARATLILLVISIVLTLLITLTIGSLFGAVLGASGLLDYWR